MGQPPCAETCPPSSRRTHDHPTERRLRPALPASTTRSPTYTPRAARADPARAGRPSARRWVPLTVAAAVATVVVVIGGAAWLGNQGDDPPAAGPAVRGPIAAAPSRAPQARAGTRARCPSTTSGRRRPGRACSPRRTRSEHAPGATAGRGGRRHSGRPRSTPTTTPPGAAAGLDRGRPPTGRRSRSTCPRRRPPADMDGRDRRMVAAGAGVDRRRGGQERDSRCGSPSTASRPTGSSASTPPPVAAGRAPTRSSPRCSIAAPPRAPTVPTKFEVTGQAATFEANVVWELKQGDQVVRNGFTTADGVLHPLAVLLHRHRRPGRLHPRRPRHRRVRRRGRRHQRGHQAITVE